MDLTAIILIIVTLTIAGYVLRARADTRKGDGSIPHAVSYIPWLGASLRFGWNGPQMLRQYRARYGANFSATIAGKRFVFLSSPAALDVFYRNRSHHLVAIRNGAERLGGESSEKTMEVVFNVLLPIISKGNAESSLYQTMPRYNERLLRYLESSYEGRMSHDQPLSLKTFTTFGLYSSVLGAIFGSAFPLHTFEDFSHIDDNSYFIFIAPWLLRRPLRRMSQTLVAYMQPWKDTLGEQDIEGVSPHGNEIIRALIHYDASDEERGDLLLTYIWGIFTNTTRVLLWLFIHLLDHKDAYMRLRAEIERAVEGLSDISSLLGSPPSFVNGQHFPLLDSAIKETYRLHSVPTSYRTVASEVAFPSQDDGAFFARPGDIVVANIYGAHMDNNIFSNPHEFQVDRFLDGDLNRYLYMFGKGDDMCTGRHLAKYVLKMFVILCLYHCDVELGQGECRGRDRSENPRCTGIMLPTTDISISLTRRRPSGDM